LDSSFFLSFPIQKGPESPFHKPARKIETNTAKL
jgi:hypothetical protein